MMIKLISVAAIMAATYHVQGAIEAVVVILSLLAFVFYTMAFRLFVGLSQAELISDANILQVVTVYMIYITMAIQAYMSDYTAVVYMVAPWLIIQALINVLTIMIKLEFIEIRRK
jgi:hypothetical protein